MSASIKGSMLVLFMLPAVGMANGIAFSGGNLETYAGVGTQGLALGVGAVVMNGVSVRGEFNYLDYRKNFSSDSVDYTAKLKYKNVGVYLDFFPLANGFRLSTGALLGSNRVEGNAVATNGQITINGNTYNANGQYLNATVKFPEVRPYLGIGYGHANQKGLGFYADLGVAYGKPSTSLNASPLLAQQAAADLAQAQQDLNNKAKKLTFMPVLNVGLSYAF